MNNKPEVKELPIARIRRDSGAQFRGGLNAAHVQNLVEVVNNGATLDPIVVFFDGSENWLADGDHRIEALLRLEQSSIAAKVFKGTREDAVFYGAGANTEETLPRTPKTKRAQVTWLLQERQNLGISGIAKHAKVSRPFVYQVINDDPELKLSCKRLQDSETRIAERGGKEYTMNVSNMTFKNGANQQNDTSSEDAEYPLPLSILTDKGVVLDDETSWCGLMPADSISPFPMVYLRPNKDKKWAGEGLYDVQVVTEWDWANETKKPVFKDYIVSQIEALDCSLEQLGQMHWKTAMRSPVDLTSDGKAAADKFLSGTIEVGQNLREVKALIGQGELSEEQYDGWVQAEMEMTWEKADRFIAVANAADVDTSHTDLMAMAGDAWWGKDVPEKVAA